MNWYTNGIEEEPNWYTDGELESVPGSDVGPAPAPMVPAPRKRGGFNKFLGLIGDALLIQGGANPMYRPQVEKERKAAALKGFTSNPLAAFERYVDEDPETAFDMYDKTSENMSQGEARQAQQLNAEARYRDGAVERASRLARSATPQNWPMVRDQMRRYLKSKGIESPFPIPEEYDETSVGLLRDFGIATDKQVDDDRMEYGQDERLEDADLNRSSREGIARESRLSREREGDKNRGVRQSEGAANRSVRQSEGAANRQTRKGIVKSQIDDRRNARGNKVVSRTVNKRGETVVHYENNRVTTLRDSVDPRGKGKTIGSGSPTRPQREGVRYRDKNNGKTYVIRDGKRDYD